MTMTSTTIATVGNNSYLSSLLLCIISFLTDYGQALVLALGILTGLLALIIKAFTLYTMVNSKHKLLLFQF